MDCAEDVEIRLLIDEFYSLFDNRGGRRPNFDRLRELFSTTALIIRVSPSATECWSLDGFIAPRRTALTDGSLIEFHEWEVSGRTVAGTSIASRWSEYETRGLANGHEVRGRGRKLIQLFRQEGAWRIGSVLWEIDQAE